MDNAMLKRVLRKTGACLEAVSWIQSRCLETAWDECHRADWMLWLVGKMADKAGWPTRQQVVLAACSCAETALKYVKKGELRPAKAIGVARAWARVEATIKQVREAADADAADAAAYAAAYAAAARFKALAEMADIVRKEISIPYKSTKGVKSNG